MKLRLLPLLLLGAATTAPAEDCPLFLNQRFQLHYNQWQISQSPSASTTQALYEVEAGLPIFTYRLGALAVNGAVEYNRLSYGAESDSESGLSRYGARISLFPYRPFRLHVDYQHSQTPDLFDSGRVKGDVWGAGMSFNSRLLQDIRLSYRHGSSRLGDQKDDWSLWKLEANQRNGTTQAIFQATRQEFTAPGSAFGWRMFIAGLDTESHIGREWMLRTRSQIQDTGTTRWFDLGTTFYGPITGFWHSLTTASAGAITAGQYRTATAFASESMVFTSGRWNAHATGAFSQSATRDLGLGTRTSSAILGGAYALNQDWRIHADLGVSGLRQTFDHRDASSTTTTMNLGIARGGDVPELIRHSLFFLSDWSFDRRVREEYPPDFVPSELAQDMLRRRMRQTGSFGFTADLWRIAENVGQGKMDWARVTGQVQTRGNFHLFLAGDYKRDAEMTQKGMDTRNADLMANGSYRMGNTSITGSMGYSSTHRSLTASASTLGLAWAGSDLDAQSRNQSVGLTTRLWKVPFGVMVLRYDSSLAAPTTTVSTWADLSFRQVSLRVRYEVSRMENGIRSERVTLDLLRWFDTACVRLGR
ncbi:MAG: hypothetical protein Q8K67_11110 [Geothrix sp.]|nr:hypothetical protein [Geothrix sp.]